MTRLDSWGKRFFVRGAFWMLALAGLSAGSLSAANIQYQIFNLGGNQYRFDYTITGLILQVDQEIDIRFDPAIFSALANGVAPFPDFDLLLLQPNNPPLTFGDYSAVATINNPSMAGPFRVDATIFNGASLPSSQPFFINQLDSNGAFVSLIESGNATSAIPEPRVSLLVGAGLLLCGVFWFRRTRHASQESA